MEKLWIVGVLIIILGGFLFSLFVLSNEEFSYFSSLSRYTIGFLITGLIASIFGFLLTIINLDEFEEVGIKTNKTTKKRVVLIAVTIIYTILIGYMMFTDQKWTVKALIIGPFGFFGGFTVSAHSALIATLLTLGVFVLPFVIDELGVLVSYPDELPDADIEEGLTIEEAEKGKESFNRFAASFKQAIRSIRIKNYSILIGTAFAILGSCFVGLPPFFLKDGPLTYDTKTETWFIKDYKGFNRGQLLLIGILFLVIGFVLSNHYRRRRTHSTDKEKLRTS